MLEVQKIRVGFIGTGWADRIQIPTFRLAGLIPQAVCSGHVENAQRVAQEQEIPEVYESWQQLVVSDSVDLVSVVAPPHLHAEISVAALQAGKHVICEKPTALDASEAETMLAASQAAPDQLAIIDHELRFNPARVQMREMVRAGAVGSILTVDMERLGGYGLDPALPYSWHYDAERGGGMLGGLVSHLFDLARWMVGRVDALTAQLTTAHYQRPDPETGEHRPVTADDRAPLLLKFGNGARGSIMASAITPGRYGMTVLVVGTEGALRLDEADKLWGLRGDDFPNGEWAPIQPDQEIVESSRLPNTSSFTVGSYYLAQTLAATLSRGEVIIPDAASFYDGLVVQRALDAARRSHAEGVWVGL